MKRNSKRRRKEARRLMSIYRREVDRINKLKEKGVDPDTIPDPPTGVMEKAKALSPGSQFNERRKGPRKLKLAVPIRLPRSVRREAARERARQEWRSYRAGSAYGFGVRPMEDPGRVLRHRRMRDAWYHCWEPRT